jgi:hypothetical protein
MKGKLFRRKIRLLPAVFPILTCACGIWVMITFWKPASPSIDWTTEVLAALLTALAASFVLRHPDDFAPRACGRCGRFLKTLEIPFNEREFVERLKEAVECGDADALASLADSPVPLSSDAPWVCVVVEACPTCTDRTRVSLVELSRERLLAGPSEFLQSSAALLGVGARRRTRVQPLVGLRLRGFV